ncbi:hypothetical protein RR21198_0323 [Rhodococcus rhodochrous ATCC 21198]|nr:hypothetical protein RR21198_0323 [Rhodococcus rhodochrous ATCC 21198]
MHSRDLLPSALELLHNRNLGTDNYGYDASPELVNLLS